MVCILEDLVSKGDDLFHIDRTICWFYVQTILKIV